MKKQLSEIEKKEYSYLISVLSSAVNETSAPLPYDGINWRRIFSRAKLCGLNAAFANTVLTLPKEYLPDDETIEILKKNINAEIFIDSNHSYEIEKVLSAFDKHKIKNVPLKGYFLKKEYPRSDYRSISDYDILFDRKQIDLVKKAFSEIGYEFLHNDDNQFHFQKKPYMYIEMHATLVHEWELYYSYLVDIINKSVKRDDYEYSYELSLEDHYLYMLVHNSNHFRMGGLSIRMLLDTYLYYRNHKDELDFDYLNEKLRLFKLETFEKRVREIAFNWFSPDKQKITFDDLEVFILLSARLGRLDAGIMIDSHKMIKTAEKEGKRKSKFSYFLRSLFPDKKFMSVHYPYVNKLPFLLPVSWVQMWFTRFFIDKNVNVKGGFKNRFSYTDDDVKYYKGLLKETGFDDFDF